MDQAVTMDKIISLAKRRGFVYQGSEIYGGLANSWDYGPLGVELKNNIKKAWWDSFVRCRHDVVGIDSAIMMNPSVWKASGHVGGFSDPLMDCKSCKKRHRADKLIEETLEQRKSPAVVVEGLSHEDLMAKIVELDIQCPACGTKEFTDIRQFNLMFKTHQGVTDDSSALVYLRPETAQGIFVNFRNIATTSRKKIPFGIAQVGKSFRNEITPGNFIFRTREFEQMEMEYFCHPDQSMELFAYWKDFCEKWVLDNGLKAESIRMRDHSPQELSHYSSATTDIDFRFPFGWGELWGVAHRGNFDLTQHQTHSKKDLQYTDPGTGEKYLPHVIEPALGVDRLALAFILDAYEEEALEGGESRVVLKLDKRMAPIQVAFLPLSKKLSEPAQEIFQKIAGDFVCDYDESQSIGKRYRRQDEIGTPYCVTIDFDTLEDSSVTVRDRDSMVQDRVSVDQLHAFLSEKLS
ncbi:MAG: glycine--tRNA ligase [Deltaproteobacteria bacterium]|nr:glycine--tRNA ligase [Deltaproteobacteria bacterium]MBT4268874.1 glycine--tRNA ligase [Deltaproteobacteria bacterium]MBT4641848.1 glycine--tRNA ligase [Deltaproteobacteria bacterium]MBT6504589.1 glycine--tRNA ligase [Deltaproteobacteria bacterium]MBT6611258.1 glycine--tRNA ligase [Deltaproteobacteria bacterium]